MEAELVGADCVLGYIGASARAHGMASFGAETEPRACSPAPSVA
jgi:hypothetical protein